MNEQMTKELIRDVKTENRTKAIETLVLAFAADPQLRFLFPNPLQYQTYESHWHLPLIGVDPSKQGNGYGSALLQYGLELIDRQGSIAYLENTNPANRSIYERHEFEELGVIQVDDSLPLFPMIRYSSR